MTSYKCSSFNSLTGLFFLWLWTVKSGQKSRSAMVSSKDSASGRASFSSAPSSKLCNMNASFENKSPRFYKPRNVLWLNNFHLFSLWLVRSHRIIRFSDQWMRHTQDKITFWCGCVCRVKRTQLYRTKKACNILWTLTYHVLRTGNPQNPFEIQYGCHKCWWQLQWWTAAWSQAHSNVQTIFYTHKIQMNAF